MDSASATVPSMGTTFSPSAQPAWGTRPSYNPFLLAGHPILNGK
jgi:hypothetical protein